MRSGWRCVWRAAVWLVAALMVAAGTAWGQPAVGSLVAPVRPACISSPFGVRPPPGPHAVGFHNGIDLPAVAGAPVFAAAAGQVASIHREGPGGVELSIMHAGPNGPFTTLYAHLGLIAPAIARGKTRVAAGERIAVVGRSGIIYGTHLYFEVLVKGRPIDPAGPLAVEFCVKSASPGGKTTERE